MRRFVRLMVAIGVVAGGVVGYALSHPAVAPAMHLYHLESSVTVVHTLNGYHVVKLTSGQSSKQAGQTGSQTAQP